LTCAAETSIIATQAWITRARARREKSVTTVIWWTRRDLRLADNQALAAAMSQADRVVPVFVLDPVLLGAPEAGSRRLAFLFGGLRALDESLRALGSRLLVRRGDPATELALLCRETGASRIYAEEDPWPYARRRDARVGAEVSLILTAGLSVHPSGAVRKADGSPYGVFGAFRRAWHALPLPSGEDLHPAPARLGPPPDVMSLPIPTEPSLSAAASFPPGEAEALRRLRVFAEHPGAAIYGYDADRDRMDLPGTSQLSPYFRFGMISARRAMMAARRAAASARGAKARQGAETWLTELIWREFYMSILYHFPDVLEEAFRPALRDILWDNDATAFAAWCEGRTGYPVVDAGMRQLMATGWMHNRARMIAASFLVKDLLIDWRWGERFFMQHLLDGDPAANNGGWQWTAGTGTDPAPYFRVFNPVLQGARFDPEGHYVRRWVPELSRLPDRYIHEPWRMPSTVQRDAGCVIGHDYPAPIIDHNWARGRALAAYRKARSPR
jgi:deoxyribodipyrimidine photo-lyase